MGAVRGVLPFLAVLVDVISPGKGMAEQAAAQQQQAQEQFDSYVRSVATTGDTAATPADQLAGAKELLDAGTIDQAEFDRLQAKRSPDHPHHQPGST